MKNIGRQLSRRSIASRSVVLTALVVLTAGASVYAQDAPADDAWKQERKELKEQIKKKAVAKAEKQVDKKGIEKKIHQYFTLLCQRLKVVADWSTREPDRTKEQVSDKVKSGIQKQVDRKYPPKTKEDFEQDGKEEYRLYERGDEVSFTIRGGLGTNTLVEGKVYAVTENRVQVGNRWIVRKDMNEETQGHFYPAVHERLVEKYVRVHLIRWKILRDGYFEELLRDKLPDELLKAGYLPKTYSLRTSTELDNWVPAQKLVDYFYETQVAKTAEKLEPGIEKQVFANNGYVKHEGEWMPQQVAESLAAKLKNLVSERPGEYEDPGMLPPPPEEDYGPPGPPPPEFTPPGPPR